MSVTSKTTQMPCAPGTVRNYSLPNQPERSSTPVVGRSDGPEPLLSSCVPLYSVVSKCKQRYGRHRLTIWSFTVFWSSSMVRIFCMIRQQPHQPRLIAQRAYKVNTDRGNVALSVGVICEPEKQAGLPDARVSNEEELKEVVISEKITSASPTQRDQCNSRLSSKAECETLKLKKVVARRNNTLSHVSCDLYHSAG